MKEEMRGEREREGEPQSKQPVSAEEKTGSR